MAKFLAMRIKTENLTIDEVPEKLKTQVEELLKE